MRSAGTAFPFANLMNQRLLPVLASVAFAVAFAAAGAWLDHRQSPAGPRAPGTVFVEGETSAEDEPPAAFLARVSERVIDQEVELTLRGRSLGKFRLRELGAELRTEHLLTALEERPSWESVDASLDILVPTEELAKRLADIKDDADQNPLPARRLIDKEAHTDDTTSHRQGSYLDIDGACEGLLAAARRGDASAEVPLSNWEPAATRDRVASASVDRIIGAFETRFGGAKGRNGNIERATRLLDGLVLMPGEIVSFNDTVGPRTVENGFFMAPEIYKGEMRNGIGGGACQVASTLYASAFFAGLDVTDRVNHSRPSAYIRPGLDATVSFPVLDLRIRNPFEFAVVVSARAEKGRLRFELFGQEPQVEVTLATATKSILKYGRKLERAALPEREYRLKQKGKRGMSLARIKTTKFLASGETAVEQSTDLYPPTQEIYLVGPGLTAADLPPLEEPSGV